jgi:hypothetical protein
MSTSTRSVCASHHLKCHLPLPRPVLPCRSEPSENSGSQKGISASTSAFAAARRSGERVRCHFSIRWARCRYATAQHHSSSPPVLLNGTPQAISRTLTFRTISAIDPKRSSRAVRARITKRRQGSTDCENHGGHLFVLVQGQPQNCRVERNRRRAIAGAAKVEASPDRQEADEGHGSLRKSIEPVAHSPV